MEKTSSYIFGFLLASPLALLLPAQLLGSPQQAPKSALSKVLISKLASLSLVSFIFDFDRVSHSQCHCLSLDVDTPLPSLSEQSLKLSPWL